jgi:hypothetical protein
MIESIRPIILPDCSRSRMTSPLWRASGGKFCRRSIETLRLMANNDFSTGGSQTPSPASYYHPLRSCQIYCRCDVHEFAANGNWGISLFGIHEFYPTTFRISSVWKFWSSIIVHKYQFSSIVKPCAWNSGYEPGSGSLCRALEPGL